MFGIKIVQLATGHPSNADGQWVSFYDPTKNGERGEIRTTADPNRALRFDEMDAAVLCWGQSHGTRPDGRPNRPLTAFTVSIEPLP